MSNQTILFQGENKMIKKSEILFLYDSTYSIPNGDPFTGEQRIDEETKKILVSDVRIKRFVRDYLGNDTANDIYVLNDRSSVLDGQKMSGAAARMKSLKNKFSEDSSVKKVVQKKSKKEEVIDALKVMQKCIDVRLFGGISTEEGDAVNLTGPVQFALLNPSLNSVDLRMHQNTSVFSSSTEKSRGAIGTTSIVPYAINQIHGWVNPYSALETNLSEEDVNLMLKALWNSINNSNTRSKSNQNSLLLLQIIYKNPEKKLYKLNSAISLDTQNNLKEEAIRDIGDYSLNFDNLKELAKKDFVEEVRFYTELDEIKTELEKEEKFNFSEL